MSRNGSNDDATKIMTRRDDATVIQGANQAPKGRVIGQGPAAGPGGLGGGSAAPSGSGGETVFVPGGAVVAPPDAKSASGVPANFKPVVGWLAVVKGPSRGECMPLYYGPNSIGRGDKHIVRLDKDQRVSRDTHGFVIYDDARRKFFIRDNQANPIYFKGRLLMEAAEIANRDVVTIGETTLMFIALCDQSFDWSDQDERPAATAQTPPSQ